MLTARANAPKTARPPARSRPIALTSARLRRALGIAWRAARRVMERDVMLFAGGVSFFGLLAAFPAVTLALSVYAALVTPDQAVRQVAMLAALAPPAGRDLLLAQAAEVASAPWRTLSAQGLVALLIALYASVRGIKGLLAGLHLVAEEPNPRGAVAFNLQAAAIAVIAALAGFVVSAAVLTLPMLARAAAPGLALPSVAGSATVWAFLGMAATLALLYRLALRRARTAWSASVIAALAAAALWVLLTKGVAAFGDGLMGLGFAYGSVAAVVVLLTWLHLSAYAVFYGAALAAEIEDWEREG